MAKLGDGEKAGDDLDVETGLGGDVGVDSGSLSRSLLDDSGVDVDLDDVDMDVRMLFILLFIGTKE